MTQHSGFGSGSAPSKAHLSDGDIIYWSRTGGRSNTFFYHYVHRNENYHRVYHRYYVNVQTIVRQRPFEKWNAARDSRGVSSVLRELIVRHINDNLWSQRNAEKREISRKYNK